jgi:hypothetical protein
MIKKLIDLTRELLNNGVFNHLPDAELARLQWIIIQGGQDDRLPLAPVLSYWYRGDFYSQGVSPRLLQLSNEFLQRIGQPLIDVYGEEFYEA